MSEASGGRHDVIVVGSGNAGLSAALTARAAGADVLVIEAAPEAWVGGNSAFTAGAFRTTYSGLEDLRPVLDLDDEQAARIDLAPYTADDFLGDIQGMAAGRSDPELTRILADEAGEALHWLAAQGVRWELLYARQSFPNADRIGFWGNLTVGAVGGGIGLIESEVAAARAAAIEIRFDTRLIGLERRQGSVVGAVVADRRGSRTIEARAVVLASGGFEADARRRSAHLGPGWDLARVRGTPWNTGDPLFMALDAGAASAGNWSGCHAIAWDAASPLHGDRAITNRYSRQSYPFGLVVNREGRRFVDEGADFRNYTYAKYGAEIMRQPGAMAFQLFDQTTLPLLATVDYDTATASRTEAGSVRELAERAGIQVDGLERTIAKFNAAVGDAPAPFVPSVKDGRAAAGAVPPKSNWANRLEKPPFVAFAVTCGITFTFGGVRIDLDGRVLDPGGRPLSGLYACGEIVGGLFHHNYPGGSGLTSGTVFGRRAGAAAAGDS